MPHHQSAVFDWATDIDESIGPIPSPSDFHPTTPLLPTPQPYPLSSITNLVTRSTLSLFRSSTSTPHPANPNKRVPSRLTPLPFYPSPNQSPAHPLTQAQMLLSDCPIPYQLYSRNPTHSRPQQLSRQPHVNLVISPPFTRASKILGGVSVTGTTVLNQCTKTRLRIQTHTNIHTRAHCISITQSRHLKIHSIRNQNHIHIILSLSNSISIQNCKYQRKGNRLPIYFKSFNIREGSRLLNQNYKNHSDQPGITSP